MGLDTTSDITVLSVPEPLVENPYQRLLYRALGSDGVRLLSGRPNGRVLRQHHGPHRVLHVHWLWLKSGLVRRASRELRFRRWLTQAHKCGWKIIWTAHNVIPHEAGAAETRLRRTLVEACDGIIAHTHATREDLRRSWAPACPIKVIPHGHYRDAYPAPPERDEARQEIGLGDRPMVLFLGHLRRYKGVDDLVRAFRNSSLDATLLVCGAPKDGSFSRELGQLASGDPRIRFDPRFIPPEEIPTILTAADVIALPFRQVTTSGSLVLALSFDRPVIIPDHPALREVSGAAGEVYDGSADIVPALQRVLAKDAHTLRRAAREACDQLGWDAIADATLAFFRRICNG